MRIKWYAHAAFRLEGNGLRIVTDPYVPEVMKLASITEPADLVLRELRQVVARVGDRAVHDPPVLGEEGHDREGRGRLAAAALPRQAEGFPFAQGEVDPVHRADDAVERLEVDLQAADVEEGHVIASGAAG